MEEQRHELRRAAISHQIVTSQQNRFVYRDCRFLAGMDHLRLPFRHSQKKGASKEKEKPHNKLDNSPRELLPQYSASFAFGCLMAEALRYQRSMYKWSKDPSNNNVGSPAPTKAFLRMKAEVNSATPPFNLIPQLEEGNGYQKCYMLLRRNERRCLAKAFESTQSEQLNSSRSPLSGNLPPVFILQLWLFQASMYPIWLAAQVPDPCYSSTTTEI